MTKSDQQHITQHKRFALRTNPNFCYAKTSFILGTLYEMSASLRRREKLIFQVNGMQYGKLQSKERKMSTQS